MTNGSGYGTAPVTTDANGRYEFSNVPSGIVVMSASAPHAYQRCAEIATVSGADAVKNIELLDSAVTTPATTSDSPTLSGVVYRRTTTGKQPVAGAVVEFEFSPVPATMTTTDPQGGIHSANCRPGAEVWKCGSTASRSAASSSTPRATLCWTSSSDLVT